MFENSKELPVSSEATPVIEKQTSFVGGAVPDWISTSTTGGGNIITNTGEMEIETGTNASGDGAEIAVNENFVPDDENAYLLTLTVVVSGDLVGGVNSTTGFNGNLDYFVLLNHDAREIDIPTFSRDVPTKNYQNNDIRASVMFWPFKFRTQAIVNGFSSLPQRITDPTNFNDTSITYKPIFLRLYTNDTSSNNSARLKFARFRLFKL